MPLFAVDIEKSLNGENWTNRYIIDATDLSEGTTVGGNIRDIEKNVHAENIIFERYRVRDLDPLTDLFTITPDGGPGLRATTGSFLPLFNVARIDFGVFGGRPSRKYLRIGLTETDVDGDVLVNSLQTTLQTSYRDPLVALAAFVDIDGQAITSGTVFLAVQMRQLRRGSRRRTQPIIQ